MYPSNTYVNTSYQDNDFDPNLGIQDFSSSNSSCFFHFPSPLNQYEDDAIYLEQYINDMFHQNYDEQQIVPANKMASTGNFSQNDHEANMKECLGTGGSTSSDQQVLVNKKVSKKDRHSKINTAHGPRDRRMRLSLDVARKFFWLQDMLGFDKASKTVQWLFKHSESAIKEIYGECPQMNKDSSVVTVAASSTSDGEAVSGIDQSLTDETAMTKPSTCSKKTKNVRKPSYHFRTKESREKARERAKERTKEKKKQQLNDQQSKSLMTWNPYGAGKHLVCTSHHTFNYKGLVPSYESEELQYTKEQQMQNQGIRMESITIGDPNFFLNGDWSPSTLFNYQQPSGISHENQPTDFQFYGA